MSRHCEPQLRVGEKYIVNTVADPRGEGVGGLNSPLRMPLEKAFGNQKFPRGGPFAIKYCFVKLYPPPPPTH